MSDPRILFLDAYDSYSNNIIALVRSSLNADVSVVKIDDPQLQANKRGDHTAFHNLIERFDAVIAGPGPGNPCNAADVGLINDLWSLQRPIPVFGICLGFQSLALAFGAKVQRLREPRHGIRANITHCQKSIYAHAEGVQAILYNSLHVDLGAVDADMWSSTNACPDLQPLAWILDDEANGNICVAVKHTKKPFWGVQYHPESICTNDEGARIIQDWWQDASAWLRSNGERPLTPRSLSSLGSPRSSTEFHSPEMPTSANVVRWQVVPMQSWDLTWTHVESCLSATRHLTLLESGTGPNGDPVNPETGRFSIMSCTDLDNTDRFEYSVKSGRVQHLQGGTATQVGTSDKDLWECLEQFIAKKKASCGAEAIPFWGGLVGFVSYEACLTGIGVKGKAIAPGRPDACFVYVDRSIVIDHVQKQIYIQSIRSSDQEWVDDTTGILSGRVSGTVTCDGDPLNDEMASQRFRGQSRNMLPKEAAYKAKVEQCKERIREGQSYELCLTDQTVVQLQSTDTDAIMQGKQLYRKLRLRNPAPFAAMMSLPCGNETVQILSSSPERFLNWTRTGRCQFRPIKGTVKKGPGMNHTKAEEILKSDKEQAENLMIVDLIRHDLHGVLDYENVKVSKLMVMEEYRTVYQLVSVIEGQLPADGSKGGIEVLAASLPPGSMTGAPKKRACELLQDIETKPRGIYSGVLGYLDVGGGGDFSVVIRTAINWTTGQEGGQDNDKSHQWTIGAGGAVTIQSTAEGEFEEMEVKRDSLFSVFGCANSGSG